jgi:hypothetical protein|nr:MAG TPA: minor structural protein [Bacteriophage sp.]
MAKHRRALFAYTRKSKAPHFRKQSKAQSIAPRSKGDCNMNILTRKNLKALNVPDEAIDAIVEAHSDAINDIKAERDKYAEQAKQIETLTTERDTLKQQLADAKKSGGDAQKIKEAFDAYKQQVETEKRTATLTTAARKLLTSKGMQEKLADLVMAKRGLDGIELDDKGAIKDGDKLIDALKGEYGDLFSTQQQQGTPTTTPPSGGNATHGSGRAAALAAKYAQDMYGAVAPEGANK